jgi:hypothetical protein
MVAMVHSAALENYAETPDISEYVEYIGPTWAKNDDGTFILPERTLGWECIAWIMENLTNGEKGEAAGPFLLTPEQGRFILWWYAIDENGRFIYDEGTIQRLKGWGKDPLLSALNLFEALGNCRFDGWSDSFGFIPKTKGETLPLVQIVATTQNQTDTTMRLFRHYLSDEAVRKYRIEINTESVKSFGIPVIFAVTGNPEALEGKSSTFVFRNETQHWNSRIAKEMASVIARNTAKVKGGAARVLSATNAFDPNLGSVAQETREAYELQMSNMGSSKILYDSIEINPAAPIFIFKKDELGNSTKEVDLPSTEENISRLVKAVRGDSHWSVIERIIGAFFDPRNPPDEARRFWLNTIVSSEDSWIDVRDFDKCVLNTKKEKVSIKNGDTIAMFFDGSKSNDSTVLMGCRISDGLIFKIAAWHKPNNASGPSGTVWLVPRNDKDKKKYDFDVPGYLNPYRNIETVDAAVDRAFRTWKVVGFFADPSHAREDVDNRVYWDSAIEKWHVKYSSQLKVWAGNKSGAKSESINWDMINSDKIEEFAEFAERTSEQILRHELLIQDDDGELRIHFRHAKIYKTRSGLESIWKGKRNSQDKIDLAVASIGALMVRSKYLKQNGEVKKTYSSYARFK